MKKKQQKKRRSETNLQRPKDHRCPFERDLGRLIHSASFRRLQAKTQVLGIGEGDFHRTRLTHSMEVAQVGRSILRNLRVRYETKKKIVRALPDDDLIFFAGLAHDLGHPPFGHGGEVALNYAMRNYGGFEGNGQTLRILSKLEAHTTGYGLDPARRTLLSIVKYPASYSAVSHNCYPESSSQDNNIKASDWKPPKCYFDSEQDVFEWIVAPLTQEDKKMFSKLGPKEEGKHGKTIKKSLDTTILDLADDIAYGVHDLEDSIALGLVTSDDFRQYKNQFDKSWCRDQRLTDIENDLFGLPASRKQAIGALVNAFIVSSEIKQDVKYKSNLLKYDVFLPCEACFALDLLKKLVVEKVIRIPEVRTLEYRGQHIIMQLFDALASDPGELLPSRFGDLWKKAQTENEKMRIICDYVAGMTDEYATRLYERMFVPRHGTIFQKM
ncbi:MAG TPA: deoxyguanosinetriphosphate triphosphohydrolase family protein [Desulfobulbus sp.]|nr:deoxyguanosinetriphosphate triphosphohydrolase family protein [Desulfobulbus sp.]